MAVGGVQLRGIIACFYVGWDDKGKNFMMQELQGRIAGGTFLCR